MNILITTGATGATKNKFTSQNQIPLLQKKKSPNKPTTGIKTSSRANSNNSLQNHLTKQTTISIGKGKYAKIVK